MKSFTIIGPGLIGASLGLILKKKKLAIFTFIHGKCLKNWNKDICYSVGKELAKLHQLSTNFHKKRNNDFSINKWVSIFENLKKEKKIFNRE